MALAKTMAVALFGLNGTLIDVEADISSNLPNFILVGLPDASLSEATSRVRAACTNSGLPLPGRRITVNLSPAAVPKRGSSFDLAIAVAVLAAAGAISSETAGAWLHIGELALDGSIRRVNGVLPSILAAKELGWNHFVVPVENLAEAEAIEGVQVESFDHLSQVAAFHGSAIEVREREIRPESLSSSPASALCYSDVLGQAEVVDAMVIAAAGGHHLLMVGPPGAGKTMMAERLTTLLPDLSLEQSLETTAIHSVSKSKGKVGSTLISRPPFESPHHSSSASALVGGGLGMPSPGLVSLAHNGVLFLDEAPEFQTPALESLRQAIERGQVSLARSAGMATFPSRFQLVLAANPCPCGQAMNLNRNCTCTPNSKSRYLNRLSGPLLDRIDIRLRVRPVNAAQIEISRQDPNRIDSAAGRQRVISARAILSQRLSPLGYELVTHVPPNQLRRIVQPGKTATRALDTALAKGSLSMRGYDRCIRIGFTVAALEGRDEISAFDLDQAYLLRGTDNLMAAA